MKIKKWFQDGNEGFEAQGLDSTEDVLCAAGRLMDDSCTHDIVGPVLFQAKNGKYYTGTVEFVIKEADPEDVKDLLEGLEELA